MKIIISAVFASLLMMGAAKADGLDCLKLKKCVPDVWGIDLVVYGGKAFQVGYVDQPFEQMLGFGAGAYIHLSPMVTFVTHLGTESKLEGLHYNFSRLTLELEAMIRLPGLERSAVTFAFQGPLDHTRGFGFFVGFDFATIIGYDYQAHTGFGGGKYFTQPDDHLAGHMKGRLMISPARFSWD